MTTLSVRETWRTLRFGGPLRRGRSSCSSIGSWTKCGAMSTFSIAKSCEPMTLSHFPKKETSSLPQEGSMIGGYSGSVNQSPTTRGQGWTELVAFGSWPGRTKARWQCAHSWNLFILMIPLSAHHLNGPWTLPELCSLPRNTNTNTSRGMTNPWQGRKCGSQTKRWSLRSSYKGGKDQFTLPAKLDRALPSAI